MLYLSHEQKEGTLSYMYRTSRHWSLLHVLLVRKCFQHTLQH